MGVFEYTLNRLNSEIAKLVADVNIAIYICSIEIKCDGKDCTICYDNEMRTEYK